MRAAYDEVYVYTMGRTGFILQHVVDAFVVQTANDASKPLSVVFGLVGRYLHVEKQFSGRQVQKAHMELGRRKREWPRVDLPEDRGSITVADVLAAPGLSVTLRSTIGVVPCGLLSPAIARRSSPSCGNTKSLSSWRREILVYLSGDLRIPVAVARRLSRICCARSRATGARTPWPDPTTPGPT
jgi:Family of unknown function (DUF5946)